jgi:hypothetical protein
MKTTNETINKTTNNGKIYKFDPFDKLDKNNDRK